MSPEACAKLWDPVLCSQTTLLYNSLQCHCFDSFSWSFVILPDWGLCDEPGGRRHAVRSGAVFPYNVTAEIQYACVAGYEGGGSSECLPSGDWTAAPQCTGGLCRCGVRLSNLFWEWKWFQIEYERDGVWDYRELRSTWRFPRLPVNCGSFPQETPNFGKKFPQSHLLTDIRFSCEECSCILRFSSKHMLFQQFLLNSIKTRRNRVNVFLRRWGSWNVIDEMSHLKVITWHETNFGN